MYYPKSQIKPNLHTNGGEYILSTTQKEYKGYYYEISNGNKYTGKSPQDGPNILLISIQNTPTLTPDKIVPPLEIQSLPFQEYSQTAPTRIIPSFNLTIPTDQDKSLGVFSRYFCKKNNELIYIEINHQTFNQLKSKETKIAWDLYTPISIQWYIKGDKEKTYKANKGLIILLEQNQKWYGFSKYLKEDFLKYYVGE